MSIAIVGEATHSIELCEYNSVNAWSAAGCSRLIGMCGTQVAALPE